MLMETGAQGSSLLFFSTSFGTRASSATVRTKIDMEVARKVSFMFGTECVRKVQLLETALERPSL